MQDDWQSYMDSLHVDWTRCSNCGHPAQAHTDNYGKCLFGPGQYTTEFREFPSWTTVTEPNETPG